MSGRRGVGPLALAAPLALARVWAGCRRVGGAAAGACVVGWCRTGGHAG